MLKMRSAVGVKSVSSSKVVGRVALMFPVPSLWTQVRDVPPRCASASTIHSVGF